MKKYLIALSSALFLFASAAALAQSPYNSPAKSAVAPAVLAVPSKTPVNAVASQGTITMSGIATVAVASQGTITMSGIAVADETFVVDDQTFTWKAARSVAGEVTIGADAPAAVTNIVTAITADLSTVTAADGAGDTVVVTAATEGTAGDSIVFTEASTNMAVDGAGTLGGTTAGVDADTFVVDDQTFTWKSARAGTGDVAVGAGASVAVTNIVTAITADLSTVTAVDGAGDTVVLTAATAGTVGDSIVLTDASTNMAVDGSGTLGGTTAGVDGTLGVANEVVADNSYLYICIATNTTAGANWRRISIGAAY